MNSAELRNEIEAWIAKDALGVVRPRFPLYLDDARVIVAALERLEALEVVVRFPTAVAMHREGPVVVCDDGTVWWWCSELSEWCEYDPIPGTRAATPAPAGQQGGEP